MNNINNLNIANILSMLRLGLVPIIWFYAWHENSIAVGCLTILCLLTDFFDGFLARLLKQETSLGAKLDSIADSSMLMSLIFWIYFLRPNILENYFYFFGAIALMMVIIYTIMLIKFGRIVEIHTYFAKLGNTVTWFYFIWIVFINDNTVIFIIFFLSSILYLGEDIFLLLTRKKLDENERGIFFNNHIGD